MRQMRNSLHVLRDVGVSVALALVLCGTAFGQELRVSGTVTSETGTPLRGVTVRVSGTDVRAVTDAVGRYSLTAPSDAVLVFASIGYRAVYTNVGGRTAIDVAMSEAIAVLSEVIVTGYTEQRRADITGAVSSVNLESADREISSSILKRLDGRVAGVTVERSGSPGSRNTVRIRGVSSFQNNDPLYIVDGTPVEDSYINWLNPNDIESIQVLKDASAASIYGSRANNGVVIIETKKGRPGPRRVTLEVRTGVASPVRGYDDFLIQNSLDYFEVVRRSQCPTGNAVCLSDSVPTNIYGNPSNPTVPAYIWPNNGVDQTGDTLDTSTYAWPGPNNQGSTLIMPGSPGTNWWDAVFSPARVSDVNFAIYGGGEDNLYSASFNYFDQEGTAAFNRFRRGTIRLNTEFDLGRVTVGENLALSIDENFGGADDPGPFAEGGILGKNILMQPVVPVHDIGGNFASGKAVGLGNQSNPLKEAWANKDDVTRNTRIFGNVFANVELRDRLSFRTRLGFNLAEGSFRGFDPIRPENSEPGTSNGITENFSVFTDWTWSNTLSYAGTFEQHNVAVLVGQEATQVTNRVIAGGLSNLISTIPDSRYIQDDLSFNPGTRTVSSGGSTGALLSFFGKIDYNFADRYYLSFTLRRDGSSRLGPSNRWGTFPAIGAGWRLSQESFLADNEFFSNVMLRFGWGLTGNQNIPSGRIVSQFGGGPGDTFYDIGGTNSSIVPGFRQTSLGNPDLKWEENQSVNVGLDLEFLEGRASVVVDVYERRTDNLLFDPPAPGTAGVADPPIVNIGEMRNRGIDFSVGYRGTIGTGTLWNVSFNGSHYRNEVIRIDGVQDFFFSQPIDTRFGEGLEVINMVGHPIGAFFGLVADGFYANAAEAAPFAADGAAPGRIKFRDLNGDGQINSDDRTIIGSPHPDFAAGLDFGVRWGAWDVSATLFGTFGNDIYDVQKEFYIFRNFSTNVRADILENSWRDDNGDGIQDNPDAKYPRLDVNDAFSRAPSSFYIEDGSYVRLRNLQVGYQVPQAWIPGVRVYVQAENLFTITGYPGLDPALPAAASFGPAGDIRDQARGIDRGAYPSNRVITFGVSATF
ncbi:MAG: SusC/RagA family TonB-linked outer membrane protein [Gemmatimonadales bacterium]